MAATRISPTGVQVSGMVYTFANADIADDFEVCIIAVGALSCELKHSPVSKRLADANREKSLLCVCSK
jgi:hypothetical protein